MVRRTDFSRFHCSLARTLEVVGDWWTPLLIRDMFLGIRRFDELVVDLGIPRNILTERLAWLRTQGVIEKRAVGERRRSHEYVLTESGRELVPAFLLLTAWGDRWRAGREGPPMQLSHRTCGESLIPGLQCTACGRPVELDEVGVMAGPGGRIATGTAVIGRLLAGGADLPLDAPGSPRHQQAAASPARCSGP